MSGFKSRHFEGEIALSDATCIRIGNDVCLTALRRVVSARRR